MTESKRQNRIYLLTTISIYVGLVLVGGAPEVFASSELNKRLNGPSFEISTRSESIVDAAKYRKHADEDQIVPHDFPGSKIFELNAADIITRYEVCDAVSRASGFQSQNVLTTPLLPRASL